MEELEIEVDGTTIIVTMPSTSFQASFFKHPDEPRLLQNPSAAKDSGADISTKEFEALAWEAANARARELGWIP